MKPSSIQEAISIIQATFPAADLSEWAAQPKDLAVAGAHFELGMWIRNQWVYPGSLLTAEIESAAILIEPDAISEILIKVLWDVLNGKPYPTVSDLFPNAVQEPDEAIEG